jgi:5-methyltetrahydrofolate corrinoid/iron sulfur protein methyltransferase
MIITVAENINIMSKTYGPAIRGKDPKPIQDLAARLTEAGADYLDLNLGPARKAGGELMDWLVRTVQEATNLPLYLDTTNADAVEAGLKAYRQKSGKKAVINSVPAVPERMDREIPMAKNLDGGLVALCYGPEGIPRDENERGALAAELLYRCQEAGIAAGDMWFDPIVVPVSVQQIQLQACTNFVGMLPELAPGCLSTCGLSNVSNGLTDNSKRPILNQVYLSMLKHLGIKAAIVDAFDKPLMDIARDKRPDLDRLVARVLDGEQIDLAKLSKDERDVVKTVNVLTGKTLFSESWLEV